MKRLLLSTAIVFATVAGTAPVALAETQIDARIFTPMLDTQQDITASDLIGMRVYVPEAVNENLVEVAGLNDGWNDVGEVHDVILTRDGMVRAVVLDIGGFLGIGEHQIAVGMDALRFVADSSTENDPRDFFLVLNTSPELLKDAPAFDPETWEYHPMAQAEGISRPGYTNLAYDEVTTEDVTGAPVYDARDEWIGEVGQLIMTTDGKLDKAIIDVGGFLGLGEKPVALEIEEVTILRNADGGDLRIYVDMTKEQLEALPEWTN